MKRIQQEFKTLLAKKEDSQNQRKEAFKGLSYEL